MTRSGAPEGATAASPRSSTNCDVSADHCTSNTSNRGQAAVDRLHAECANRDLGPAAHDEYQRLVRDGRAEEVERVIRELPPAERAGDIVVCPETTAAFLAAWGEHLDRVAAQRTRIVREVGRLGGALARGEITSDRVALRVDTLAHALDPTAPVPVHLLPWRGAEELAWSALAAGVRSERGGR